MTCPIRPQLDRGGRMESPEKALRPELAEHGLSDQPVLARIRVTFSPERESLQEVLAPIGRGPGGQPLAAASIRIS